MEKKLTREEYHKGLIGKIPKKLHKEMLEEFDKKENEELLRNKLMEMPELEDLNNNEINTVALLLEKHDELKNHIQVLNKEHEEFRKEQFKKMAALEDEIESRHTKRMNNINTFQCCDGELCLRGTDEMGADFTVWYDAYDFLDWIDTNNLQYIKDQIKKHIDNK
tara:strand:- start:11797 stop:12291 length:495 start_codon:yes stop_codon:yes gene_type:complete